MYFSEKALAQLAEGYSSVKHKYEHLVLGYFTRTYKDAKAQEYAMHGFVRRLKTLVRCIENVFTILPPERTALPTANELADAVINIQAFVFNVFGSIDNLAWIWVQERSITNPDGTPLNRTRVGLTAKNEIVRASFSKEFRDYLVGLDEWICHLEDFRHALAHRIPLYIPPSVISTNDEGTYRELEVRKSDAFQKHDFAEYERLTAAQDALGKFMPWMTHSFEEKAKPVVFHAQLLADFNTVDELGLKMLAELKR